MTNASWISNLLNMERPRQSEMAPSTLEGMTRTMTGTKNAILQGLTKSHSVAWIPIVL